MEVKMAEDLEEQKFDFNQNPNQGQNEVNNPINDFQQKINSQNQNIANAQPQQASTGNINQPKTTRELTQEEINFLKKISNDNYLIKKTSKKVKKANLSENARLLSKVRRLYTAKISLKYYFCPIIKVNKLRSLAGADKKGGAALFNAAAKKTRNLIATIIIVISVLAVIGAGAFVTLVVIGNDATQNPDIEGFTIVNTSQIAQPITNYTFGKKIDVPVKLKNTTGENVKVRLLVEINVPDDLKPEAGNISVQCYFDNSQWHHETLGDKTYITKNENMISSETDEVTAISGYQINIAEGANENIWATRRIQVVFTVYYGTELPSA